MAARDARGIRRHRRPQSPPGRRKAPVLQTDYGGDPVLVHTHMRQPPGETAAGSWRHHLIECMEAIMRERNSNSRMALRAPAEGGDGFAVVLDFEFLSRPAPPCKQ